MSSSSSFSFSDYLVCSPGDCIGDYVLRNKVSQTVAAVWHAHPKDDQQGPGICLKMAGRGMLHENAWKVEVSILQVAHHPNIIGLLGTFQHVDPSQETQGCIVTEWMGDGVDLFTLIQDEANMPWQRALGIIRQILDAVNYLHTGMVDDTVVVHADLKPENIMVTPNGVVKLIDFGSASVLSGPHRAMQADGHTTEYRAPEVICESPVTTGADIWSVGCIIYQICSSGGCLFETDLVVDDESDDSTEDDSDDGTEDDGTEDDSDDSTEDDLSGASSGDLAQADVDVHQLLLIRATLGNFPESLTRQHPRFFNRAGGVRASMYQECEYAIPMELEDAEPGSRSLTQLLEAAGCAGAAHVGTRILPPMLHMDPQGRITAREAVALLTIPDSGTC